MEISKKVIGFFFAGLLSGATLGFVFVDVELVFIVDDVAGVVVGASFFYCYHYWVFVS